MNKNLGIYDKCEICEEFHWSNKPCNAIFYFRHPDFGDDFQEIRAFDFEDAAEKFGTLYNEDGDYVLMNGGYVEVEISDGHEDKKFKVYAEARIEYYAEEITNG